MINESNKLSAEISLIPESSSIRKASDWVTSYCLLNNVPIDDVNRLLICLNEVLANILEHGGPNVFLSAIQLKVDLSVLNKLGVVTLTVADSGAFFNPTKSKEKKCPTSLALAEPGGLGVTMINKFSDEINYRYIDGKNTLSFSVNFNG